MTDKKNSFNQTLEYKQDLFTVLIMGVTYCISAASASTYGYLFSSLTLAHAGFLFFALKCTQTSIKLFMLLPMILVGNTCFAMASEAFAETSLQTIINGNVFTWLFMGLSPFLIQRAVFHYFNSNNN